MMATNSTAIFALASLSWIEIAVAGNQIAQLSFVILGYHWHFGANHAGRNSATIVEVSLPDIG